MHQFLSFRDFILCVSVCVMYVCWCGCVCGCQLWLQVSSSKAHYILWGRVFHWIWSSLIQPGSLASEPQGYVCLCLMGTEITDTYCCTSFYILVLGFWSKILMLQMLPEERSLSVWGGLRDALIPGNNASLRIFIMLCPLNRTMISGSPLEPLT